MKGLPPDLTTEIEKEYFAFCHLFQIGFSATLYYTDADIDVYYDGHWWNSTGIAFDAVKLSTSPKVDSISFDIDNVNQALSAIILSEEVRGKECTIWQAALDKNMSVIGVSKIFVGYLDGIEIDNQRARIQLYNHFIRWKMLTPRRTHSATCQWTFKSTYCGYSDGGTWCDHSWERCVALGNKVNFGGFKWLPYLVDKQIWWGRAPK
jgi:hypothetical protein